MFLSLNYLWFYYSYSRCGGLGEVYSNIVSYFESDKRYFLSKKLESMYKIFLILLKGKSLMKFGRNRRIKKRKKVYKIIIYFYILIMMMIEDGKLID